jgi:hypothetical protein
VSRGKKKGRPQPFTDEQLDEIVDEFLGAVQMSEDAVHLVELIVEYDRVRPLRVGVDKLRDVMEWIFKQPLLPAELSELPVVLHEWGLWAARRNGVSGEVLTRFDRELLDLAGECDDRVERLRHEAKVVRPYLDGLTTSDLSTDVIERRSLAVPRPETESLLDPSDPEDRRLLVMSDHTECGDRPGDPLGQHLDDLELITTQLWHDDPPEVWRCARHWWLAEDMDRIEVLHLIAEVYAKSRDDPGGYAGELTRLRR